MPTGTLVGLSPPTDRRTLALSTPPPRRPGLRLASAPAEMLNAYLDGIRGAHDAANVAIGLILAGGYRGDNRGEAVSCASSALAVVPDQAGRGERHRKQGTVCFESFSTTARPACRSTRRRSLGQNPMMAVFNNWFVHQSVPPEPNDTIRRSWRQSGHGMPHDRAHISAPSRRELA